MIAILILTCPTFIWVGAFKDYCSPTVEDDKAVIPYQIYIRKYGSEHIIDFIVVGSKRIGDPGKERFKNIFFLFIEYTGISLYQEVKYARTRSIERINIYAIETGIINVDSWIDLTGIPDMLSWEVRLQLNKLSAARANAISIKNR
jgi:hypothetical protein